MLMVHRIHVLVHVVSIGIDKELVLVENMAILSIYLLKVHFHALGKWNIFIHVLDDGLQK